MRNTPVRVGKRGRGKGGNERLFDAATERVICQRYEAGDTTLAMAEEFGCSRQLIGLIVKRNGGKMRPAKVPPKIATVEEIDSVVDRYREGASLTSLANEIGVSRWLLAQRLKSRGIPIRVGLPVGENHPRWRGGRRVLASGYVRVWVAPDDDMAEMRGSDGSVFEHRLVMARSLGRPLTNAESVHHIDGDRQNNTIENLQLRARFHGTGQRHYCADCGSTNILKREL